MINRRIHRRLLHLAAANVSTIFITIFITVIITVIVIPSAIATGSDHNQRSSKVHNLLHATIVSLFLDHTKDRLLVLHEALTKVSQLLVVQPVAVLSVPTVPTVAAIVAAAPVASVIARAHACPQLVVHSVSCDISQNITMDSSGKGRLNGLCVRGIEMWRRPPHASFRI